MDERSVTVVKSSSFVRTVLEANPSAKSESLSTRKLICSSAGVVAAEEANFLIVYLSFCRTSASH